MLSTPQSRDSSLDFELSQTELPEEAKKLVRHIEAGVGHFAPSPAESQPSPDACPYLRHGAQEQQLQQSYQASAAAPAAAAGAATGGHAFYQRPHPPDSNPTGLPVPHVAAAAAANRSPVAGVYDPQLLQRSGACQQTPYGSQDRPLLSAPLAAPQKQPPCSSSHSSLLYPVDEQAGFACPAPCYPAHLYSPCTTACSSLYHQRCSTSSDSTHQRCSTSSSCSVGHHSLASSSASRSLHLSTPSRSEGPPAHAASAASPAAGRADQGELIDHWLWDSTPSTNLNSNRTLQAALQARAVNGLLLKSSLELDASSNSSSLGDNASCSVLEDEQQEQGGELLPHPGQQQRQEEQEQEGSWHSSWDEAIDELLAATSVNGAQQQAGADGGSAAGTWVAAPPPSSCEGQQEQQQGSRASCRGLSGGLCSSQAAGIIREQPPPGGLGHNPVARAARGLEPISSTAAPGAAAGGSAAGGSSNSRGSARKGRAVLHPSRHQVPSPEAKTENELEAEFTQELAAAQLLVVKEDRDYLRELSNTLLGQVVELRHGGRAGALEEDAAHKCRMQSS